MLKVMMMKVMNTWKILVIEVDNQHIPRVSVDTLGVVTRILNRVAPLVGEAAA